MLCAGVVCVSSALMHNFWRLMRIRRLVAAVGTTSLVAASTLLIASPASAETVVENVTFYEEADFGVEPPAPSSYPAGADWFFGDDSDGQDAGTATFTPSGLAVNDGSGTNGIVQILNQNVTTPGSVAELISLVDDVIVYADSSDWTFQLPLFTQGDTGFTTLRPVATGTTDPGGDWITSWAIPGFAADAQAPLSELLTAIYEADGADPVLLAYGLWFAADQSPTVQAISWGLNEVDYPLYSAFVEVPTRSVAPTTMTVSESSETTVTFTGTGWLEEDYYLEIFLCEGSDEESTYVPYDFVSQSVSEDGTMTVVVAFPEGLEIGQYCAIFDDNALFYHTLQSWWDEEYIPAFTVTDDAAAEEAAEEEEETLPATGADPAQLMVAATVLLLLGAAVLVTVQLRRRAVES